MKKLFILGSGFTRAFSSESPTLDTILANIIDPELVYQIQKYQKMNIKSPEEITSLLMDNLYDSNNEEILSRNKTTFRLIKEIQNKFINIKADKVDTFMNLINRKFKSTNDDAVYIATFNYDMLIEDNSVYYDYLLPIEKNPYEERPKGAFFGTIEKPIKLLKLHGSINWFCNSNTDINLNNTFYFSKKDKSYDYIMKNNSPVIVPFVFNKSYFMNGDLFTIIWRKMDMLLNEVDEINFIGYGFPKTDYQFLPKIMNYYDKIRQIIVLSDPDQRLSKLFSNKVIIGDAAKILSES